MVQTNGNKSKTGEWHTLWFKSTAPARSILNVRGSILMFILLILLIMIANAVIPITFIWIYTTLFEHDEGNHDA